jgi:hypothetical protein
VRKSLAPLPTLTSLKKVALERKSHAWLELIINLLYHMLRCD